MFKYIFKNGITSLIHLPQSMVKCMGLLLHVVYWTFTFVT